MDRSEPSQDDASKANRESVVFWSPILQAEDLPDDGELNQSGLLHKLLSADSGVLCDQLQMVFGAVRDIAACARRQDEASFSRTRDTCSQVSIALEVLNRAEEWLEAVRLRVGLKRPSSSRTTVLDQLDQIGVQIEIDRQRFVIDSLPPWQNRFDDTGRIYPEWYANESAASVDEDAAGTTIAGNESESADWGEFRRKCIECCRRVDSRRKVLRGMPAESDSQVAALGASLRWVHAQALTLLDRHKAAFWSLDQAESSLDPARAQDRFLMQGLMRQRAEVLMTSADADLRRGWRDRNRKSATWQHDQMEELQPDSHQDYRERVVGNSGLLRAAQMKLDRARNCLEQAEQYLATVQRNLRTWRRLYESRAQLEIEHLLALAVELEFAASLDRSDLSYVARIQKILVSGLDAVRGMRDCSATVDLAEAGMKRSGKSGPGEPARHHGMGSLPKWLRLMACGWALFSALVQKRKQSQNDWRTTPHSGGERITLLEEAHRDDVLASVGSFLDRWVALNLAAGLGNYVIPEPIAPSESIDSVSQQGGNSKLKKMSPATPPTGETRIREWLARILESHPIHRVHRHSQLATSSGYRQSFKPTLRESLLYLMRVIGERADEFQDELRKSADPESIKPTN